MNSTPDLLKALRIDRTPEPPPSRHGPWITVAAVAAVVAVVLLAGLAWLWLGASRPLPVRTATVVASGGGGAAPASVLDASGYVVARRIATVSARITGRVREVTIEEGMAVEAGQVLATLDPIDADAQQALATSRLAAARSQIGSVQARLTQADAEARRLQALVGQQLVSRSQHDQAVAQRDALRAELDTARRNAQVARDQLALADIGVDDTTVRAPFAGVITAKAAQPGEIVSPLSAGGGFTRTGIGTIVDMDSLEIEVDVGEAYIGRVKPKMPVAATLNAYPDWRIPAEVIAIVPSADRGRATVKVRVAILARDARIVPEMGVSVSFLEQALDAGADATARTLRVPAAALVERDGATVAFVVRDGRVERRDVDAAGDGDPRELRSGLSAGEQVVLAPPDDLGDGDAVSRE